MAMYDIEALLEEADALTVATYLGMEIKRKGNNNFIRCPGHEDRLGKPDTKISNCVLFDKGYTCFACGTSVGIIQMVQEFTGCSFPEALNLIAESCGGQDLFKEGKNGKKKNKKQPLSAIDLKIIGFEPNYDTFSGVVVNASKTMEDAPDNKHYLVKKNRECLVCKKQETLTLTKLFSINESLYSQIVSQKAKEAMIKYEKALRVFCSRDAEKAPVVFDLLNENDQISDDVFFKLASEFQKKYWRAKEIYEEYQKK